MTGMLQIVDEGSEPVPAITGKNYGERDAEGDRYDVKPRHFRLWIVVAACHGGQLNTALLTVA
jgi:hypothetical protein